MRATLNDSLVIKLIPILDGWTDGEVIAFLKRLEKEKEQIEFRAWKQQNAN